jgi:CRISPR-associated protein Csc3
MLQITLLEQAVAENDTLMRQFVKQVVPGMMERYTFMSAKGGRFADRLRTEGIEVERFDRDQSMLAHLLNGIFPAITLVRLLAERGVRNLSEIERKVYLAAYTMHDLDKILKIEWGLDTHDPTAIQDVAAKVSQEFKHIGMDTFFPDYADYLDDIVFLMVNTQHQKGTHLSTYAFQCRLKERQLSVLRQLCTYSDIITYLVRSPEHVIHGEGASRLKKTLDFLSQDTLVLAYHKLNEVRGLLTNALNNSVMQLLKVQQAIPYLFFPNGVVYLVERNTTFNLDLNNITQSARTELSRICAQKIKHDAPAFKFDPKGLVKKPDYYHDFLSPTDYVQMIGQKAVQMTQNDISVSPAKKMNEMKKTGDLPEEVEPFEPDIRIGVLARFLINLWKEVIERLPDEKLREQTQNQVLEYLGLTDHWSLAQAIPGKGGVEYKWFWLAAQYLDAHPGIDTLQGEGNLYDLFNEIIEMVLPNIEENLDELFTGSYLLHLQTYLAETLEIYPQTESTTTPPDFAAELEHYLVAKRPRKAGLICTLCHSSYPTEVQADSSVLFQPWVYKNKLNLYAGSNAGGLCAICALELMLRQIMLKGELRLTGSKFEGLRTKYFYLYPAYFFTTETAQVVRYFITQLKQINLFSVRKQLRDTDLTPTDFINLESFIVEEEEAEDFKDPDYLKMEYPKDSFPALIFFGMRAGSRDSDTEAWVKPAFLALTLPLILNVKTVVSELPMPLFATGNDFKETVILDAPHPFLKHLLTADRLRIYDVHHNDLDHQNDIYHNLVRLTSVYTLSLDTFADGPKPHWNQLTGMSRRLVTDPMWVFAYMRKQQRGDSLFPSDVKRHLKLYELLGGNMSLIKECVDRYTVFYSGGYKSHSITKPVDILAKAIINSEPMIDPEDLKLEIRGELMKWLDRVRSRQAEGYAKFWGKEIDAQEMPAVREFVDFFYDKVFGGYCRGERGVLRSRYNRFRDGCEAYYVEKRATDKAEREAAEQAEAG